MSEQLPLVLVVEDEPDLADLYAAWLGDEYRVRTAYGGREALDELDEADEVDAILLDRRMPGLSGDEVLTAVRDRGIDCRVAMVTAVEPDFDILEMGFDDYLVKPVSKDDLLGVVETMRSRSEALASIGTKSLSWKFTPYAPTSARRWTRSTGDFSARTGAPNGS